MIGAINFADRCNILGVLFAILIFTNTVAAQSFQRKTIDSNGNTGEDCSIALNIDGFPTICYYSSKSHSVKCAYEDATGWHIQNIDNVAAEYISLEIDGTGVPHISYYDDTNNILKYAVKKGSSWSVERVDTQGNVGAYSDIAIDDSGNPHITYRNYINSRYNLKYARKDESGWHIETIHSYGSRYLSYCSIALDAYNNPYISYFEDDILLLKYFDGSTWQRETLETNLDNGEGNSIAIDKKTGKIGIAYNYDEPGIASDEFLVYGEYDGNSWNWHTVDNTDGAGLDPTLRFDYLGNPHISYCHVGSDRLKYAYRDEDGWHILYPGGYEDSDKYCDLALNVVGEAHFCYYDDEDNDLEYVYPRPYGPKEFDLIAPPNGTWADNNPNFLWFPASYRGEGLSRYELIIDGNISENNIPPTRPFVTPNLTLSDGWHTWNVKAVQEDGTEILSTETWSFRTDSSPPEPFSLSSPNDNSWSSNNRPTFQWEPSTDSGSTLEKYQLFIDGSLVLDDIDPSQASIELPFDLTDGTYAWFIVASDIAGNSQSSSETWSIRIDTNGPSIVQLISPFNNTWTGNANETFCWHRANDIGIGLENYILNFTELGTHIPVVNDTCYSLSEDELLPHGAHRWSISAIDSLGNQTTSQERVLRVDLEPPTDFTLTSPLDSEIVSLPTPTFSWLESTDANSGFSHYELWIDSLLSRGQISSTSSAPSTPLKEGHHFWYIKAFDNVGNLKISPTRSFFCDWNNPSSFHLIFPLDGSTVHTRYPQFAWNHSIDNGSGILKYQLWINGTIFRDNISPEDSSYTHDTPLNDGQYNWFIKAIDRSGNETSSQIWSFKLQFSDTEKPTVNITAPNGGEVIYGGEEYQISWTASDNVGIASTTLKVSYNAGISWTEIDLIKHESSMEKYSWSVPDIVSDSCLINISVADSSGNNSNDSSDNLFSIKDRTGPFVELLTPSQNDVIYAGIQDSITWQAADNNGLKKVMLLFSSDNRKSWFQISDTLDIQHSDSIVLWKTPYINSQMCWLKLIAYDVNDNMNSDSVGTFTINRPPTILTIADTSILEDEPFKTSVMVKNVDPGDTLKFFDDSDLFNINHSTGTIEFTALNKHVGTHEISVWVNDGTDTDTTDFKLTVLNVNDPPTKFELIVPENYSEVDTLNPHFRWQRSIDYDIQDSVWYKFDISDDSSFSKIIRSAKRTDPHFNIDGGLEKNKTYYWRVFAIDIDSASTMCIKPFQFSTSSTATGVSFDKNDLIPNQFALYQNYPNPFNPSTTISFDVPSKNKVQIVIFNLQGQAVRELLNENCAPGTHSIEFDGKRDNGGTLPSGVYLYVLKADNYTSFKKFTFLK